jgi:tetratricopeptide (TPR) repeat protein/calcineurin-like phosphoesterase family protein
MFNEILVEVEGKTKKGEIPDFIFITGDIANGGKGEEYEKFKENFYRPLLAKLGEDWKGNIYLVPGNHDVDRDQAKAVRKHGVLEDIKNFLDPNEEGLAERNDLLKRFNAFQDADLPKTLMGWLAKEEGIYYEKIKVNGIIVGILGINTAWLSTNGDKENMTPGSSMVKAGLAKIADSHLKIVLGHHPTDWFLKRDREAIQSMFGKNKVIYLHGHNHEIESLTGFGAGEPFLSVQTGASFQVRPEDKIKRNRILWCEFDSEAGILKAEPRQWSHKYQEWKIDAEAFPNKYKIPGEDKWSLPLPLSKPPEEEKVIKQELPKLQADYDPRNSVFYVPYRVKGKQVVGREEALRAVHETLRHGKRTNIGQAALFRGLGGLGKTQLAVEYAYQCKDDYPNGIIWLNADQDLVAQLIDIAEKGKWVAPESEHRYKLDIARHRLKNFSDCLIIFDNVNDIRELEPYFPEPQAEPHILITSRFDQLGFNPIPLSLLDEDLSLQMLTQEAGRRPESEPEWGAAREIVKALGGLPLALELAGAYLRHRPISWKQYNELLKKNLKAALPAKMASFTQHEADLYSTLKVSERVWEEEPLLRGIVDLLTWSGPAAMGLDLMGAVLGVSDPTELTGALGLGQALHILQKSQEREAYILRRLVQEVRRVEVPLEGRQDWAKGICERLGTWFQEKRKEFSFLPLFEAEIDHLQAWQKQALDLDKVLASRLTWLQAYPPYHRGLYGEAKKLLELGQELLDKDEDLELKAHLVNDLGFTLGSLGNYNKSLIYDRQSLDIRKEVLGERHPDTAQSLSNVGVAYGRLGEYQRQLEYQQQALDIRVEIFGERHHDTAMSLRNLGFAYGKLGNYQNELEYYQQALEIFKEALGERHPETAHSLRHVGYAYHHLKEYQKSLEYAQQALEISKEVLGERHPETARALHNVGAAYANLGNFGQGLNLIEDAYRIRKDILGELHPDTINSASDLASILYETNRKQLAYQLLDQILQKLAKDHPRYEKIKKHREQMLAEGVPGFRPLRHGKKSKKRR